MTSLLVVFSTVALGLGGYRFFKKSQNTPNNKLNTKKRAGTEKLSAQKTSQQHQNPYRSVEVFPGQECCRSILNISHKTFLLHDAPRLPLPDCSNPQGCTCSFVRHKDRRRNKRRVNEFSSQIISAGGAYKNNSRKSRGRRKNDQKSS